MSAKKYGEKWAREPYEFFISLTHWQQMVIVHLIIRHLDGLSTPMYIELIRIWRARVTKTFEPTFKYENFKLID